MEHNNRLERLFKSMYGEDKEHPLDKWHDWIRTNHPLLVEQMAETVQRMNLKGVELAGAYLSAAKALILAGGQIVFDTTTGDIYGEEDDVYTFSEVMGNLPNARKRSHEWIDHLFDQFTKEFQETQLKKEDMMDDCDDESDYEKTFAEEEEEEAELYGDDDSELDDDDEFDDDDDSELDDDDEFDDDDDSELDDDDDDEWEEVDDDEFEDDEDSELDY